MKLDMHLHSTYSSDGHAPPRQILKHARKLGLGGLCITDHNTMAGSLEARKIAPEFGLVVVSGMEISSSGGHILAYGIGEEIPRELSPGETADRIRAQGGMVVAPHPYRYWSGLGGEATADLGPDAVEIINSHSTARDNGLARTLAQELKLPGTAGSDSHELPSLGRAFITVPDAATEDDVLKSIRSGKLKAGGQSRDLAGALKDRTITVAQWMGRGFKKM